MAGKSEIRAAAARFVAAFEARGAEVVETEILQPAGPLLDLYGEDIRARAFVTSDPLRGEAMLRPDFTVPVVQMHLERRNGEARYTYAGEVFRRQEEGTERPVEYIQVGYELFGNADRASADAEVFVAFQALLAGSGLVPATGDIGILIAAVRGLSTTDARKGALLRHLWRPRRFRTLIDRFRSPIPVRGPVGSYDSPEIGCRTRDEVASRLTALEADADAPPISAVEAEMLDLLLRLKGDTATVLSRLKDLAVDLPGIRDAVTDFEARAEALAAAGIDAGQLPFEASYGRTTLEYYDGFVFGFSAPGRPDLPPMATGGRYDALTGAVGGSAPVPAVGGVVRPGLLADLEPGA